MIAIEKLSEKLQEFLGNNYFIVPFYKICTDYTTATKFVEGGNIGYFQDFTDEYSKIRQSKIIGVVNFTSQERSNSEVYFNSFDFKIDFSVPTNIVKRDESGKILEEPKLKFFTDIDNLIETKIINKIIDFDNNFIGKMTMSEPIFNTIESDGEFKYCIFTINGRLNLTNYAIFGDDYKVCIGINGFLYQLDGVNSYSEIINNANVAINKQNQTKLIQNVGESSWSCTFSIDDILTENVARQFLCNIIHKNIEILSQNEQEENKKRKIPVLIESSYGVHRFFAIINIEFSTRKNGIGLYNISFIDDNKNNEFLLLNFDIEGEKIPSKIVLYGKPIGELPTPQKEGFIGWKIGDETINSETICNFTVDTTAIAEMEV